MQNIRHEFGKGKEISTTSVAAPVLSDYMDYREYLAAFYKFKRKASKGALRPYNYAVFSAAANIKSPNYLKMIIDGKRNLSDDMVTKFGKALGFMKDQTEEFRLLVHFSQATDPAERNMYLKHLSEHRVGAKLKSGEIDRKTWEKVPNWVTWIIYAMVDQEGVSFDAESLKNLLRGKASAEEIDSALNTLLASGELRKDEATGEIRKNRNLIESPEEIPVALVRKLQSQLMYLGLESLYQDQPTEREFGTLTMSLTKSEFEEIKFKLRQMRKSLHKDNSIARMKEKGERVYQLNIQLFPVTNAVVAAAPASVVQGMATEMVESVAMAPEMAVQEVAHAIDEVAVAAQVATQAIPSQVATDVVAESAAKASVSKKETPDNSRLNVSSLAATAASAADLFK